MAGAIEAQGIASKARQLCNPLQTTLLLASAAHSCRQRVALHGSRVAAGAPVPWHAVALTTPSTGSHGKAANRVADWRLCLATALAVGIAAELLVAKAQVRCSASCRIGERCEQLRPTVGCQLRGPRQRLGLCARPATCRARPRCQGTKWHANAINRTVGCQRWTSPLRLPIANAKAQKSSAAIPRALRGR